MRKLATSETAQIGQSYERNRFEVHYFDRDKKRWFISGHADTLQLARALVKEKHADARLWAGFLQDLQPAKLRIVEVKAICKVIA